MIIKTDNELIKFYNSFINYVNNNVERILMKEDSLPLAYFKDDLEDRLNKITSTIKTIDDIRKNEIEIISIFKDLKDGFKGLKVSGRM